MPKPASKAGIKTNSKYYVMYWVVTLREFLDLRFYQYILVAIAEANRMWLSN
jgi:hypothetical protein